MSRQRCIPARAKACLGLLLLAFASSVSACDDDGKTAPERCADPGLPIFDIQSAGSPSDDNRHLNSDPNKPCVTTIGHSVSFVGSPTTGGKGGGGGAATADAGAGGA
jgi:hypothetical protein